MGASLVGDLLVWLAWLPTAVALGSVAAALARRWEFALRSARAAVLSMLAYPVVVLLLIVLLARPDASSKAGALARAISQAMSLSPAGVAAVVVWVIAARRLRRARSE